MLDHLGRLSGMAGAAGLGTFQIVLADLDGLEPMWSCSAGNNVHLHAEGRNEQAVNNILRLHLVSLTDSLTGRSSLDSHVSVGVLETPSPLLSPRDVDLIGRISRHSRSQR